MAQNLGYTPAPNLGAQTAGYNSGLAANLKYGYQPQLSRFGTNIGDIGANSDLATKALFKEIFDTTNKRFQAAYNLIWHNPIQEVGRTEFEYFETGFGRPELTVSSHSAGTNTSEGTINLSGTYATADLIGVANGDIIADPLNYKGIVTEVTANGASSLIKYLCLTTGSNTYTALTFASGDAVAVMGNLITGVESEFMNYSSLTTEQKWNYVMFLARFERWNDIQLLEMENTGTTNLIAMQKKRKVTDLMYDTIANFINGSKGIGNVPTYNGSFTSTTLLSNYGKTMDGIYPTMVAGGALNTTCSTSSLVSAFESLAIESARLAEGETRFVLGTAKRLHSLAKEYKHPIQYAPNDMIANLNLTSYEFAGQRIVPIEVALFNTSLFPAMFKDLLICYDPATVHPVKLKGRPLLIPHNVKGLMDGNNKNRFEEWGLEINISLMFNSPQSGFWIKLND